MPRVGMNRSRLAEDSYDQVNHVAAKLEHDPTRKLCQLAALRRSHDLAHYRMDFEHFAQPTALQKVSQQYDGRVVAEHVSHLHEQLLLFRRFEQLAILRQRIP